MKKLLTLIAVAAVALTGTADARFGRNRSGARSCASKRSCQKSCAPKSTTTKKVAFAIEECPKKQMQVVEVKQYCPVKKQTTTTVKEQSKSSKCNCFDSKADAERYIAEQQGSNRTAVAELDEEEVYMD